ncbi:MAG: hypothetical protein N3C12_10080 [Candidatus Binatia bacterium]|nr:hypothetical protein [Candidatus Binatia bacterium]
MLFVTGEDADPLWESFSRCLAHRLREAHALDCYWVRLGTRAADTTEPTDDLTLSDHASARELAHLIRRLRVQVVHALGERAVHACQRARWLVYPAPALLSFPSPLAAQSRSWQRWLDRALRTSGQRYIAADFEARQALLESGIAPKLTTVIPLSTHSRSPTTRNAAREALRVEPLGFVMMASFEEADDADSQWIVLEILAEMIHRGVPTLLVAGTESPTVSLQVLQRAEVLDVASAVHCTSLFPGTHAAVAGADVVLLAKQQRVSAWLALTALEAGVAVVKSPTVRLPALVAQSPSATELLHPLARDDLHSWIDTMEDFRPRPTRRTMHHPAASPWLPPLEDVAREYVQLYRQLYRQPRRR